MNANDLSMSNLSVLCANSLGSMKEIHYPRLAELLKGNRGQRRIARACGVAQPSVCAWFKGSARPKQAHLALLAMETGIGLDKLTAAAGYTQFELDLGTPSNSTKAADATIDHARGLLIDIHSARDRGDSTLAQSLCAKGASLLEGCRSIFKDNSRTESALIGSELLAHLGRIICECYEPREALPEMRRIVSHLKSLTNEIEDPRIVGLGLTTSACAEYVNGRHGRSVDLNIEALQFIENPYWQMEIMRGIVISSAKKGWGNLLKEYDNKLRRSIESESICNPENVSFALEGLGRAHALMGHDSALKLLADAKELHDERFVIKSPRRTIQLNRSYAIALGILGNVSDNTRAKMIKEAISVANLHGFHRYSFELRNLAL